MRPSGTYVVASAADGHSAFVPHPLPPEPPSRLAERLHDLIGRVNRALGRLDGLTTMLPERPLLADLLMRKEALLSCQIEGARASFVDLLLSDGAGAGGASREVLTVSNCVKAMKHGLARVREGLPLSLRLLRQMHEIMFADEPGGRAEAGRFRRARTWVGGSGPADAVFAPPPPENVMECMEALERFLRDEPARTPVLIKAALAHMQLETIQPFLAGSGQLARMLILLLLCAEGALAEPLLCPSLHFKRRRSTCRELMQKVREESDWEGWVRFFLLGVLEAAEESAGAARSISELFESDRARIRSLGRPAESALQVHQLLKKSPIVSITPAARELGLTRPTVAASLGHLEALGIVRELTGRARDRRFACHEYVGILAEGTEPAGHREGAE